MTTQTQKHILLTGGAGYIGSHVYYALRDCGYVPVVIDNLSTGLRSNLPEDAVFVNANIADTNALSRIFEQYDIGAIMHFAGSTDVLESVENPEKYMANNTEASRILIDTAIKYGIQDFVFSSSASVYGVPDTLPVHEDMIAAPISPYGESKLLSEAYLQEVSDRLHSAILRYFNVAGADEQKRTGPIDKPYKHVVACAVEHVLGQRDSFKIFGNDYDTRDGTAIRDFIHVSDLADLHVEALHALMRDQKTFIMNCGYGQGISILELAESMKDFSQGQHIRVEHAPRRPGDIPESYADISKMNSMLSWTPKHASLNEIIRSEIEWTKDRLGDAA